MIKKRLVSPLIFLFVFSFYIHSADKVSDIDYIIDSGDYSDLFKASLKNQFVLGPNFNKYDYVFTYSCGGGAICGNIFSSSEHALIDFPTEFLIDSQEGDFNIDYSIDVNEICFTGKSACDSTFYDYDCYKFGSGKLIKITENQ